MGRKGRTRRRRRGRAGTLQTRARLSLGSGACSSGIGPWLSLGKGILFCTESILTWQEFSSSLQCTDPGGRLSTAAPKNPLLLRCRVYTRDGHADIFAHAHRCGYPHYPTYVGYSSIYAAHISDRHPIRIRMAIPNSDHAVGHHAVDQPPRALSLGGVHVHSMSWTRFQ